MKFEKKKGNFQSILMKYFEKKEEKKLEDN